MIDSTTVSFGMAWWTIAGVCAFLIGISKTALPGVGILAVPLMALIIPAKTSTGVILPMLIFADIFAVIYYKRHAVWSHVFKLIPWAVLGILIGWYCMDNISDRQLLPIIGAVVVIMLTLQSIRQPLDDFPKPVPTQWHFAAVFGIIAGIITMMANAAGPIMIIYLLAMRLEKHEFIGTGAWYFLILNCIKVPFSWQLGLITPKWLGFNFVMFPLITVGAIVGIYCLEKIPQKIFNLLVKILTLITALKLLLSGWM